MESCRESLTLKIKIMFKNASLNVWGCGPRDHSGPEQILQSNCSSVDQNSSCCCNFTFKFPNRDAELGMKTFLVAATSMPRFLFGMLSCFTC